MTPVCNTPAGQVDRTGMSGNTAVWVKGYFSRNRALFKRTLSLFCCIMAMMANGLFGLNSSIFNNAAEAKAKYFSGKSSQPRAHRQAGKRSSRGQHKSIRHHRTGQIRAHRQSRVRGNKAAIARVHRSRYGRFKYHPVRYHGPLITHVPHALNNRNAGYHPDKYHKRKTKKYNSIRRIEVRKPAAKKLEKPDHHIEREDATGISVIYFDRKKCEQGYDCVMRLGNKRSSAKIIVVGEKADRYDDEKNEPRIIYPPH